MKAPLEDPVYGSSAVCNALLLGLEVVVVASTTAVREKLAATLQLVEIEPRDVAGTDTLILDLGTRVWKTDVS